jgi:hypothetical protein
MLGTIPPIHHTSLWPGTWLSTGTTSPLLLPGVQGKIKRKNEREDTGNENRKMEP